MATGKTTLHMQPAGPHKTPFGFYLFMGSVGIAILAMIIGVFLM